MRSRSRSERRGARRGAHLAIRRAGRADAAAIASLGRALNRLHGDPIRYLTRSAVLRDGFGRRPRFKVLLAELGGEVVGYALYVATYETGWAEPGALVQDLFVRDGARRCGIGRALIAAVASEAKAQGLWHVWTLAERWNRRAARFYSSFASEREVIVAYSLSGRNYDKLAREGAALLDGTG